MSGGSLNYFYCELQDHVGDFNDRELDDLVADLAELFHAREWYLSSDTGIGDWNEARDSFKAKWFTQIGREERIIRYLDDFTEEIRKSFGLSRRYCRNCRHYTQGGGSSNYGRCEYQEMCLLHEYDSCNKWRERNEDEAIH